MFGISKNNFIYYMDQCFESGVLKVWWLKSKMNKNTEPRP